jgi:hypothetical protein
MIASAWQRHLADPAAVAGGQPFDGSAARSWSAAWSMPSDHGARYRGRLRRGRRCCVARNAAGACCRHRPRELVVSKWLADVRAIVPTPVAACQMQSFAARWSSRHHHSRSASCLPAVRCRFSGVVFTGLARLRQREPANAEARRRQLPPPRAECRNGDPARFCASSACRTPFAAAVFRHEHSRRLPQNGAFQTLTPSPQRFNRVIECR